jgi:predicted nucleic acid-binding protein
LKYLLDTNVISAVAPTKAVRPVEFIAWLDRASDNIFVSVVTAAEIRDGIAKTEREGATRKAADLKAWWDTVEYLYGDRILPFDLAAATIAGSLLDRARAHGHAPGFADVAIAAIAQSNSLTVLTRNNRHFEPIYSAVLNPFETLPD